MTAWVVLVAWTGHRPSEMACCHLVLVLATSNSPQNRPFLRVHRGEGQRLTGGLAVRDGELQSLQTPRQSPSQAGDRLHLQVEVLVACSLTSKLRYVCRHKARGSGSTLAHRICIPSNICSMGQHNKTLTCGSGPSTHRICRVMPM